MPEPKFLLDANMPRAASAVMRKRGFDVQDVRDIGLGSATDDTIIAHARVEGRIIVTRDTDFGAVLRHPDHPGALILRLPNAVTASEIASRLEAFFANVRATELVNAIVIVERGRYRRRALSSGSSRP